MKLSCILGRHWPLAAFSDWRRSGAVSSCVDCGAPLVRIGTGWRENFEGRSGRAGWLLRSWYHAYDRVRLGGFR